MNSIESYVHALTHELKSPLTAIRGAAELCMTDLSEEDRMRFLANIKSETERIQKIVETLLDVAALESRSMLNDPTRLDLNDIVEAVLVSVEPLCVNKGLKVHFRPEAEPLLFTGEKFLITQSVRNLIQNAIDFTPAEGTIVIQTRANGSQVEVAVIDEGPGVPEYALSRVFEKFYSLSRPDTGRKSSGLGLSFVKEAVQLHRGGIELRNRDSRSGHSGAEAILRLPS